MAVFCVDFAILYVKFAKTTIILFLKYRYFLKNLLYLTRFDIIILYNLKFNAKDLKKWLQDSEKVFSVLTVMTL